MAHEVKIIEEPHSGKIHISVGMCKYDLADMFSNRELKQNIINKIADKIAVHIFNKIEPAIDKAIKEQYEA
jgi:hypothetical protein